MAKPGERSTQTEDYRYDTRMRDDIRYNMGSETEGKVYRLANGMDDMLTRMPANIMTDILGMLDLQSIHQLSCCNSYLHEVSSSNPVWEEIYLRHHGWASQELRQLAGEITWKKVFYMNKLQLQVMLSRRRRQSSAGAERTGTPSAAVFLTE